MPSDLDKAALDFVAESLDLSPEQVIVSDLIPRPFSSICVAGRGEGEEGGGRGGAFFFSRLALSGLPGIIILIPGETFCGRGSAFYF